MQWCQSSPEISEDGNEKQTGIGEPQASKGRSNFKESAIQLITECREKHDKIMNCRIMSKKLNMERRRFYDIINVLDGIDLFKKLDADSFIWMGTENSRKRIQQIAITRGVFDSTKRLEDVFPSKKCISITQISLDIILIFAALQVRRIDLKDLSYFLSRNNGREKTMICKLYQAAAIFELAGIIEKTKNIGEFAITEDYYLQFNEDPTFINTLLNRKTYQSDFIARRNDEFNATHMKKKKSIHKKKSYSLYDDE